MIFSIGIDPGWKSCGIAIVRDDKTIFTANLPPNELGLLHGVNNVIKVLNDTVFSNNPTEVKAYIERFVTYNGAMVPTAEKTLMFIGAMQYALEVNGVQVKLEKAIDWKIKLLHFLVSTTGFKNPYDSMNKKFSQLVASTLSNIPVKKLSLHEADAICLSYLYKVE